MKTSQLILAAAMTSLMTPACMMESDLNDLEMTQELEIDGLADESLDDESLTPTDTPLPNELQFGMTRNGTITRFARTNSTIMARPKCAVICSKMGSSWRVVMSRPEVSLRMVGASTAARR